MAEFTWVSMIGYRCLACAVLADLLFGERFFIGLELVFFGFFDFKRLFHLVDSNQKIFLD